MAHTIGAWVVSAAGMSTASLAGKVLYAGVYAAVTVGAGYASQRLLSQTPDAGSAQGSMRQPIPERVEAYGYGRCGQGRAW